MLWWRVLPNTAFVLKTGAGEAPGGVRFVCGYLGCDAKPFNPLLDALPDVIHARGQADSPGIGQLISMALGESQSRRDGSEIMLARLSELLFVEVLRGYVDTLADDSRGWLSGLRDRHVGAALRLIHGRSVFAERFTHYVHMAPMHYLGRWRLQLAARLLERPGVNISEVSQKVGYESEAAFNFTVSQITHVIPPLAARAARNRSDEGARDTNTQCRDGGPDVAFRSERWRPGVDNHRIRQVSRGTRASLRLRGEGRPAR